jgi:hypothetical protein
VGLTRFADVHAANEVTRRGREVLDAAVPRAGGARRDLLEADTDGVYFACRGLDRDDERVAWCRGRRALAAAGPARVRGRYAAMLSHEPKNYALLGTTARCTCAAWPFDRAAPSPSARRSCGARSAACCATTCRACAPPTHYLQVLRDTFAARLVRALAPADFAAVFADVDQLELFATPLATIRPVLTAMAAPRTT